MEADLGTRLDWVAVDHWNTDNLGHAHPEIADAISEQAKLLLHTSNMFGIDWQERLGKRLCALSGMDRAFFCNSGAEANESVRESALFAAMALSRIISVCTDALWFTPAIGFK